MVLKKAAIVAVGAVILACAGSAGVVSADPSTPTPAPHDPSGSPALPGPPAQAAPPGQAATSGPKTTIDHDGTFAVGTDIMPGVYTSAGPAQGHTCYWKRTNGSDIVDNAMSKKPQVVQIDPTDKTFKTDGCQPWQKNDAASVDPGKSPAEVKTQMDILNAIVGSHGAAPPPKP
ncbi:hypothetical protein [Mycobacterium noviomagense]|uniref:Lipoprotein n=1 Tax=Mycobacterium noviomagense TaxID=459858 RepID=A0A7I7PJX0_9MYCO|nr:hypothetical protein [Mycobacterium noviomagense]ORB16325.1 hypothetical protein BST37_07185 [Mycobacterium noviomagense]BBY08871.1 hypothetical protein MNVI_41890 [Mycobacterium noviomagense]